MADSLGAAVLTVSVDDAQLRAGLRAAEQQAATAGQNIEKGLNRSGKATSTAANGLQYYIDAQGKARDASGRFLSIAQRQAAGIENVGKSAASAGFNLRDLGSALAGIGVGAALTGFLRSSVNAAVELDTITRKLSNTLGPQGAGQALSFTRGLSDQLGLSFKTLANSFGSFTAAATAANVPIQQQRDLFGAVSKAAQALGLSNDEINGSLLALQQVAAKGTVQMEELRGQLGERLPIAFGATARGLGITQQELIKLVETGRLTAAEFFPALTKGLNELTAGAGGTETAAQNFQKLANAWDDLQTSFGTSLLPPIIDQIKNLTGALDGIKIGIDANKLGLGGLFGNLGLVPDAGIEAVASVRRLADEYKLTAEQARALFFDAAKLEGLKLTSTGFLPDARGLERTLARLPELAEEFRQKNKDVVGELKAQQAEAARIAQEELKRRDNLSNIQEKLKALKAERLVVEIDSTRFRELNREIDKLAERLDKIDKSSKEVSSNFNSSKSNTDRLQLFEGFLSRLNVAGQVFRDTDAYVVTIIDDIRRVELAASQVRFDNIAEGLDVGTVSKSVNNLTDQLKAAQSVLDNLDFSVKPVVDPGVFQDLKKEFVKGFQTLTLNAGLTEAEIPGLGKYVKDFALANNIGVSLKVDDAAVRAAIENVLRVEEELAQLDGKKAIITVEQILEGIDDGTLTNNFNNLERRVQAATAALKSAEFGSDAFFKSLRAAQEATFELNERNKEFDPSALVKAAEEGKKAYEELGKASEKAADDAKSAAASFRGALEGSFDLLSDSLKGSLLNEARRDLRRAVDARVFDSTKVDKLKDKDLISAAAQARAIFKADRNLSGANSALASVNDKLSNNVAKLTEKDWSVNVAVNANTGAYDVQLG